MKRYSKRQLKGLIASVNIWVKKVEGDCNEYGRQGCPLCGLYYKFDTVYQCRTCPVKLDTGFIMCTETPYIRIYNKFIDDARGDGFQMLFDKTFWRDHATKQDKLKELRYLISLLPKVNQRDYKKYIEKEKING